MPWSIDSYTHKLILLKYKGFLKEKFYLRQANTAFCFVTPVTRLHISPSSTLMMYRTSTTFFSEHQGGPSYFLHFTEYTSGLTKFHIKEQELLTSQVPIFHFQPRLSKNSSLHHHLERIFSIIQSFMMVTTEMLTIY